MMRERQDRRQEPLYEPPRELWYFTPGEDEPLPTPLNELGLVDDEKLIELVKSTVDPSYNWEQSEIINRHHLYWRHSNYPYLPDAAVDPHEFCELPFNKILVPSKFHKRIHDVTAEPTVPEEEVMHNCIEAKRTAVALFSSARLGTRLIREKKLPSHRKESVLERHLDKFHARLEAAQAVPKEFQIIDLSEYQVNSVEDMQLLSPKLGEIAVRRSVTRVRDVMRPAPIKLPKAHHRDWREEGGATLVI